MQKREPKEVQKSLMPEKLVQSSRILYTPSYFAKTALLHLQEVGSLQALYPHTSTRDNLMSYLFLIVENGNGIIGYEGKRYELQAGDCAFINCHTAYSHSTPIEEHGAIQEPIKKGLWSIKWVHFYGPPLASIYAKYRERGGKTVFHPSEPLLFINILNELYEIANTDDYIRDMRINETLNKLLTMIMEVSWNPCSQRIPRKRLEVSTIKLYIDDHFLTETITLTNLADRFYINKNYLARKFKETYGTSINNYIAAKRVTEAKRLLRFSDMTVDEIGIAVGVTDSNYFSRVFKKVEGISPSEFRKKW